MVSKSVSVEFVGRDRTTFLFSPDQRRPVFTVELLLLEISKHLKLKENSLQLFALHAGSCESPKRILKPSEEVPYDEKVCFKRTANFDLQLELKLLAKDDEALHLVYEETRFRIASGDIALSLKEREELKDLEDPFFPTERQYVEYVIRNCSDRFQAVHFKECSLKGQFGGLRAGAPVTVLVSEDSLRLLPKEGSECKYSWSDIKSWKGEESRQQATFEIRISSVFATLELLTIQAKYMTGCAMLVCTHLLQREQGTPLHQNMLPLGKPVNPLYEHINRVVFPSVNFKEF